MTKLIDSGYNEQFMKAVNTELEKLDNKRVLTLKDKLQREYLITLRDNPTPFNTICYISGRQSEMIRYQAVDKEIVKTQIDIMSNIIDLEMDEKVLDCLEGIHLFLEKLLK